MTNIPDYRVTVDGMDISPRIRPRLVSMTIAEKRGEDADQLDLVLDDSDGRLAIPAEGAVITVEIGWASGRDVTPGLVSRGSFRVDEVEHRGPPDQITIKARSADVSGALRIRREQSWHDTTIGAVIAEIAGRNGLTPRCAADIAAIAVPTLIQSRESDAALLRRMGREQDAVATVKHGALIFTRAASGTTAGGQPLPTIAITRASGDQHSYRVAKREGEQGVTAAWHDRAGATQRTVTVGTADGARRLSRVYPTEAAARQAAQAEYSRAGRRPVSFDYTLALGRPDAAPECRVSVSGFKPEIDAVEWIAVETRHSLSNSGYTTQLTLERA